MAQYRKSSGLEYFEENLDKWSKTADKYKQWQLNQLEKKTNIWYNIEKTAD